MRTPEEERGIGSPLLRIEARSAAERSEMTALGLLTAEGGFAPPPAPAQWPYENIEAMVLLKARRS